MMKNNYISIAKAIGIILMVVGHAISQNFAYRFIYIFHMPLFFFCSGYFYRVPTSLDGVRQFAVKRFRGLYWPFVKWGVLFLLFHNLFCTWKIYDPRTIDRYSLLDHLNRLKSLIFTMTGQDQLIDPFWFLKQLLLSSLLICIATFLLQKIKYKDIVLCFFFILMAIVSKFFKWGLPILWDLSIIFLSTTFVFMGYLYRMVEKETVYSNRNLILSSIIVLLVVWRYNDYLDMLWYNSKNLLLLLFAAFVGIFMVLCISKKIERWPVKKLFYYIGNHTMIILVLHLLVFKIGNLIKIYIYGFSLDRLADYKIIPEHNELFWMIYVLLGCLVPLFVDYSFRIIGRKIWGNK